MRATCQAVQEFWALSERLLRQLELAETQAIVSGVDLSIQEKYERLKTRLTAGVALIIALLLVGVAEWSLHRWQWLWLMQHPNSYSIRLLAYAAVALFVFGGLVPRSRPFCWLGSLLPLLIALVRSLGGPRPGR
jgi:hypothetical protein